MRSTYLTAAIVALIVVAWIGSGQLREDDTKPPTSIAEQNRQNAALIDDKPPMRVSVAESFAVERHRRLNPDVESFFADKHVNVAIPFGGGGTFYSDWQRDDPKLGRVKWETFLTQELPPFMADRFGSDNVNNAVAGLSMSGTSALNLAAHHLRRL